MKMLAVLVIVWSHGGAMTSQQIEMSSLEACKARIESTMRLMAAATDKPDKTWLYCVERK
jgi:hypothetical protein